MLHLFIVSDLPSPFSCLLLLLSFWLDSHAAPTNHQAHAAQENQSIHTPRKKTTILTMRSRHISQRVLNTTCVHPSLRFPSRTLHTSKFASLTSSSSATPATFQPSQTCLLFPGQGSQRVGSGVRSLETEWPHLVKPIWEELDETLQIHLSRTMKDGLQVRDTHT